MAVEFYDWLFLLGFSISTGVTGFSLWFLATISEDAYSKKLLRSIFLLSGNGLGFILAITGYFSSPLTGASVYLLRLYILFFPVSMLYLVTCVAWTLKERASKQSIQAYYALPRKGL